MLYAIFAGKYFDDPVGVQTWLGTCSTVDECLLLDMSGKDWYQVVELPYMKIVVEGDCRELQTLTKTKVKTQLL